MGNPNDALILFATYLAIAPAAYLAPWKGWGFWLHLALHLLHRVWLCFETLKTKARGMVSASQHPVYERVEENFLEIAFVGPLVLQALVGSGLIVAAMAKRTFRPEPKRALIWVAPDVLLAVSLLTLFVAHSS